MTEHRGGRPDEDRALDARIRAGLDALVAESPDPPDLAGRIPGARPAEAPGRRPAALAIAAVVLALAGAAGALLVLRDDPPSTTVRAGHGTTTTATTASTTPAPAAPAVPDRPLYGTIWGLVSATVDGRPVEPMPKQPTTSFAEEIECPEDASCVAGPTYGFFDGCNSGGGGLRVEGDTLTVLGAGSTLAACPWPAISPAFSPVEQPMPSVHPTWRYAIDGDRLRLSGSGGVELAYRAIDDPFARPDGAVVEERRTSDGRYRLVWEGPDGHSRLDLELALRDDVTPEDWHLDRASVDVDALDPSKVEAAKGTIGAEDVVFGIVPGEAVTAVYEGLDGSTEGLRLIPIPGSAFQVVADVVPTGVTSWTVTVRDADGGLIETFVHQGR
jgi:heat shock protein HslJ